MAKRLRKYRIEAGYTIYSLAQELGVDPSTISYWEKGKMYPRHPMIIALEDIFRKHYRDMFTDMTPEEDEWCNRMIQISQGRTSNS